MINIMKQVNEGNVRKFWVDKQLLYFGNHIYISKSSNIRKDLLNACYDLPWDSHLVTMNNDGIVGESILL